jgi:hypothetical protein
LQFTASGHTEVRVNAIMITSTVIVVLVSTMVRLLCFIIIFINVHVLVLHITQTQEMILKLISVIVHRAILFMFLDTQNQMKGP